MKIPNIHAPKESLHLSTPERVVYFGLFSTQNSEGMPDSFVRVNEGPDYSHRKFTDETFEPVRQDRGLVGANFNHSEFPNQRLVGRNLLSAQFNHSQAPGTVFDFSILDHSKHRWANYRNASFQDVKMAYASFNQTDLTAANLAGALGHHPDFLLAKLANANLDRTVFLKPRFEYADLTNAQLNEVIYGEWGLNTDDLKSINPKQLKNAASFQNAQMAGCQIKGSQLTGANFTQAALSEAGNPAQIINTFLQYANFTGAQLSHVQWQHAHLQYANFYYANLTGADFSSIGKPAYLRHINLEKANLTQSNFETLTLKDIAFDNTTLNQANFNKVSAKGLSFQRSSLTGSSFKNAHLEGANFSHSKLNGTNFQNANLCDAKLDTSTWDSETNWEGATYNQRTKLPAGLDPEQAGMIYVPSRPERFKKHFIVSRVSEPHPSQDSASSDS